jgi:hypothetical protein
VANLRDDKFIISCAARTGSTMLQQMLDSHPDVLCHGEVLDSGTVGLLSGRYIEKRWKAPEVDALLWRYRSERPEAFLYDVVFDAQGARAVGFKFKTDEAFAGDRAQRAFGRLVARDVDVKVIRLRRRNLLEQYISHQVARRTGVNYMRADGVPPEVDPITIDAADVIRYMGDVLARERQADEAYASHRQWPVEYEDLLERGPETQAAMLRFLGVDVRPLEVSTRKILRDSYRLVTNIGAVHEALERAGVGDRAR